LLERCFMPIDNSRTPECIDCGACCFSNLPDYLQISGRDYERLGERAVELTHFIENRAYMRLQDGRCTALVVDVEKGQLLCSVYEDRPDVCRWLERGSSHCVAERHQKADR